MGGCYIGQQSRCLEFGQHASAQQVVRYSRGLLAAAGEECYVACDKGQINPLHVQVLPIEHHPSSLAMAPSAYAEMERYLSSLRSCFAAQVHNPLSECREFKPAQL